MALVKQYTLFIFLLFQCIVYGQVGCTDPLAQNFDPSANTNDGSCLYGQTIISSELLIDPMPMSLFEQSGMIKFNDRLWIHLDSGNGEKLFTWDIENEQIDQELNLQNMTNIDWEDIAQDETHIYIGDFGNNAGNRTDLRIYKIVKSDLLDSEPQEIEPQIIEFSYPEQTDFTDQTLAHDYDCEAMIVRGDDILLFTKQWVTAGTDIYRLPKTAGEHNAELIGGIDTDGLVTGAGYDAFHDMIMLCGYKLSGSFNPFSFMIWDHQDDNILSGNKRKFEIDWPFYQLEAIAYDQLGQWYLANEYFEVGPIGFYNQLRKIDVAEFLTGVIGSGEVGESRNLEFFPNPSNGSLSFEQEGFEFTVFNTIGKPVSNGISSNRVELDLDPGIYVVIVKFDNSTISKKLVIN